MSDYFIIDPSHGKKEKKLIQQYTTLAKIVVKYGWNNRINEKYIMEFWDSNDPYPCVNSFKNMEIENVKWFIQNNVSINDPVWSADFLHGLLRNGEIKTHPDQFPDICFLSRKIVNLLKECPYGGELGDGEWKNVPAVYLKYDEKSIGFISGLLSGGSLYHDKNYTEYALHSRFSKPYFVKLGIPIEKELEDSILISPFWHALFAPEMPEKIGRDWVSLNSPYRAHEYSYILWFIYIGYFHAEKPSAAKLHIPYIKDLRKVYNKLRGDKKLTRYVGELRVRYNLVLLDDTIKKYIENKQERKRVRGHIISVKEGKK